SANNDGPYYPLNTAAYSVSAPGVLANDYDMYGYQLTARLASGPSHGTLTFPGDGSFTYTADTGYAGGDSFSYYDTDSMGNTSNTASVNLIVGFGALSAVDQTKLPADTLRVPMQILGSSSGQPATADNLSLVYNSSTAQPSETLEEDFQPSMQPAVSATLELSDTFNGAQQNFAYVSTANLSGNNPTIRLSVDANTASLATGRYADTQTVGSTSSMGPTWLSTIDGAANVVNDQSSAFGAGWDMPGLYHLFQNSASNVPAGVLLTMGDGQGWYFTQGSSNTYTSPAGPEAFSTLTSLTGGGWKLVNQYGTTYTFNSSGDLTGTELRTTATTSYGWTGSDLTSITDPFGRVVSLAYTNGLLTSISNYAGSVWTFAHSGALLSSITEPDPGSGAPVWNFGYNGNLLTNVEDPNTSATQYAFNAYNNLAADTLPGGAGETYDSEQNYGYGTASPSSPSNAVLSSTVQNSTTDPNGNTSYFTTDRLGNVLTSTDAYGNVSTYTRDANGSVTQLTEPPAAAGQASPVTNFTYDSLGNETSASGARPTYGTYVYNSFSEPTSFTDNQNHTWTWSYDTHGNLISQSDPLGNTLSWTVDSLGNTLTMTQPAPNDATGTVTTAYTRDQYERLTKITWPDNTTRSFAYNTIDQQTSVTDEDNHTTSTAYNVLGSVSSVTNAANGVTAYAYDHDGNVLTSTDPMLNVTSYQWSSRNELTQETLPAPATGQSAPVLSWSYDANGNVLTSTSAMNLVTSYTWDKMNLMTKETLPQPAIGQAIPVITTSYDNLSRKISQTNALGATTTWAYANTDVSQVTGVELPPPSGSGQGPTTTYGYDADGRRTTVANAMNHTTTTAYTADGQVASVTDNLNHTTSYVYGHGGELLSATDALNDTTSDQYDSRYRLAQTTDANSGVTQITLDPAGNEIKLVDSDNNATTWTFDPLNRPLTETNALGTTTTTYNTDSDVTSITDADGRVRDFNYDNLNRLTSEQWMSGSTVVATMSYASNLDNQLTSASDPNSAYAFTYDGDGNVLTTDNSGTPGVPHVVLSASYDALGEMTSQSATIAGTADFLNSYSYDADQRLTAVTQQGVNDGNVVSPKEIDYNYNALGQVTDTWDYNTLGGPRTDVLHGAYSYDNGDRLTGLAYTSNAGATTIDTFGWAYNAGNLVTSFTSIDGTASYGYDPTNQLTSATYTTASGGHQPANESFSYDLNGNRNSSGYSTGSDNLITSDGTFNYQHDADGNTTVRTRISTNYATDYQTDYTWDYRNRLTDVRYYDNNGVLTKHVYYIYDVFNDLIGEEDDDTGSGSYDHVERYVVEGGQPALVFDANGNLTGRNLVAPNPAGVDEVMAQGAVSSLNVADVATWTADDKLGTPRDEVDNNGNLVNQSVFSPFGEDVYDSNPSVAHWAGFGGAHVSAATALVLDGLRWLDPATGRWLSNDPIGFRSGETDLSRAVGNDPTNAIDPTGLDWTEYSGYISNGKIIATELGGTGQVAGQGTLYAASFGPYTPPGGGAPAKPVPSVVSYVSTPYTPPVFWTNVGNLGVGFGDGVSLGTTWLLRQEYYRWNGYSDPTNYNSGYYFGGEILGNAWWIAFAAANVPKVNPPPLVPPQPWWTVPNPGTQWGMAGG
ncbi:MAG: hypothetical protein B7Z73_02465, partial [Planctomycetia bacterium 21-64-5]